MNKPTKHMKAHFHEVAHPLLLKPTWLRRRYIAQQRPMKQIAEELNVNPGAILKALRRFNIQRRPTWARTHDQTFIPEKVIPLSIPVHLRYWLAAIIDGEGCISCLRMRGKNTTLYSYSMVVGNTNKRLVSTLKKVSGVGNVYPCPRKNIGNRKDSFVWQVTKRQDLKSLLSAIRPYLLVKAKQADIILSLPPLRVQTPKLRIEIHAKLAALNRKGR